MAAAKRAGDMRRSSRDKPRSSGEILSDVLHRIDERLDHAELHRNVESMRESHNPPDVIDDVPFAGEVTK